jgi:hypothetical protein
MKPSHWNDWVPPGVEPAEPGVVPIYGCAPFTPQTTCRQVHQATPLGGAADDQDARCYCEVCARTAALELHPALKKDAVDRNGSRKWPGRESSKKYKGGPLTKKKLSRQEKKALKRARRRLAAPTQTIEGEP